MTGFVLMFSGKRDSVIAQKLKSIMAGFDLTNIEIDGDSDQMMLELIRLREENRDSLRVLKSSISRMKEYAQKLSQLDRDSGTTYFNQMRGKLLYVKHILSTLNCFQNQGGLLHGRFWLPQSDLSYISEALGLLKEKQEFEGFNIIEEEEFTYESCKPPTKFYDSDLLHQFQKIVDTYGVPSYKEINPAVLTSISFPFLFGLMFGDIAHGLALLIFSMTLLMRSKTISYWAQVEHKEIFSLGILLCLMACFSVYAGLIYNDFLSLPLTFVSSCYQPHSLSTAN
jgi:V-type H+-transporting ATPase subunit a